MTEMHRREPAALSAAAREGFARRMAAHRLAVLQFSGGKDSLACLHLVRPWWDRIVVAWANAGDEYPETRELMERVRRMVPNFMEVRGNAAGLNSIFWGGPSICCR